MKSALKAIFVFLVIFGLVASYVMMGIQTRRPAPAAADFNGPTGEPTAKGPAGAPPVTQ